MANLKDPRCRICRRSGMKLMLKGEKCLSTKCILEKKKYPPGEKHRIGIRTTNYLLQIREKQKLKFMYGVLERQFRNLFYLAEKKKGPTGENLVVFLERRFDNVIYRACFASSRRQARQLIRHGHFLINNKKVDIPSFMVNKGDIISVKERSKKIYPILKSMVRLENEAIPEWLTVDADNFTIKINRLPKFEDVNLPINLQLIIELYSKV